MSPRLQRKIILISMSVIVLAILGIKQFWLSPIEDELLREEILQELDLEALDCNIKRDT